MLSNESIQWVHLIKNSPSSFYLLAAALAIAAALAVAAALALLLLLLLLLLLALAAAAAAPAAATDQTMCSRSLLWCVTHVSNLPRDFNSSWRGF